MPSSPEPASHEDERARRTPSWASSTARPIAPRNAQERCEHRVAELLRAYGLTDFEHLARTIPLLIAGHTLDGDTGVEDAVRAARRRLDAWLPSVLGASAARADTERVRSLLARHPEIALSDDLDPEWLRAELGIDRSLPPPPQLAPQHLGTGAPRWLLGLLAPVTIGVIASAWAAPSLAAHGWSAADVALAILIGVLSALNTVAATLATIGLVRRRARRARPKASARAPRGRTAVVLAVYNEDSERVFAGVAAMRESLARAGAERFEMFVLSDTRDTGIAAAEERAIRRVRAGQPDSPVPLYYRRRADNTGYKSGNLADFFVRWGSAYDYVVVLDADSIVDGATLVRIAARMDADPQLGLLQLPIEPVRATTAFARVLQFTGQLYGPLFAEGLAAWSGSAANYFGHNAIVRVRAFIESCGLPELPGRPPFGGLILSHDFVEAALLRRRGWKVEIAADLEGSFEELPPTLEDFVTRDRRWAQGNLQHLRVMLAEGLAPMSRLHLLLGALSYLTAPLWLAFLLLAAWTGDELGDRDRLLTFAAGAALVLLWPKLAGLADALARRRRSFGGAGRLVSGWLFEILVSALLAPILMMHHVHILAGILIGKAVGWSAQSRRARPGRLSVILRRYAWLPIAGVALAAASHAWLGETACAWLAPIWAPLILTPLVSAIGASERAGRAMAALSLFHVPSEEDPPAVLDRLDDLRVLTLDDAISRFRDIVLDPVLNELHRRGLDERAEVGPELIDRALRIGPASLTQRERDALSASPRAMRALHEEAWTRWPVESWLVDRSSPLAPPEARQAEGSCG